MKEFTVQELLSNKVLVGHGVMVQGWVRGKRVGKRVAFIMLQDGTSQKPLQVVVDAAIYPPDFAAITIGASLLVKGTIVLSQGGGQDIELQASDLMLLGQSPAELYPLQPKRHTTAFLRSIQHLRFRTSLFGAVFRIRHAISYAIHQFFHKKGFFYVHTPLITSLDAEGAGQLFSLHTRHTTDVPSFFNKAVYLTVSGQLAAEAAMFGLRRVYTFGPAFRAENSNTSHHLAEFWMIEPEMAFCDLKGCIDLAEAFVKWLISYVLDHCKEELKFLSEHRKANSSEIDTDLCSQLEQIAERPFVRITYNEVFELLKKVSTQAGGKFVYPMDRWGSDLQKEHEHYLVGHFQRGVVVTDYPKAIKPFYMRSNEDGRTVACMDIFLPGTGEVVGGSQREERYDRLLQAMEQKQMEPGPLAWYLDTRRFGSVVHSGFGFGLDRFVQFVTGVENIRDTIPFPRTPGQAIC